MQLPHLKVLSLGTAVAKIMKKYSNSDLRLASKNKKDEFYTQLIDIEKEMQHYKAHFQGKTVYCNCDNAFRSNFFKFFVLNFNTLKIKKLVASNFVFDVTSQERRVSAETSDERNRHDDTPYCVEINIVNSACSHEKSLPELMEHLMQNKKNSLQVLQGNGDFRSQECIRLLKKADIVVSNPPFSLFREYMAQIVEHGKKCIVLGNQNAITYKEIFKLFKQNLLWLGASIHGGDREFCIPADYPVAAATSRIDAKGNKFIRIKGVRWFTNIDYDLRYKELQLHERYRAAKYPFYDNYNAINVDKTKEIPLDYSGYMGVPITFMDKYNPEQFEILGIMNTGEENKGIRLENTPHGRPLVHGKEKYLRIIIQRRELHRHL